MFEVGILYIVYIYIKIEKLNDNLIINLYLS